MPVFEYTCKHCKEDFERFVFEGEEKGVFCPKCKNKDVKKNMTASSFMGRSSLGKCAASSPKEFS